ncbi:unnamed protein product [Toxocara canis]|uniref:Serine/threonine-protein phosphatase n=1 Tax=Toxocara canis TaxID=6265 RepID=A0A183UAX9_TOXCA|nr:unnamed protein product [Toxocara canis]
MPNKLALCELKELCLRCRELFLTENSLLLVSVPVYIFGDLHGQFTDLVMMLTKIGVPPRCRYLFLGDYVDRGNWSLETISLLMAYKLRYPRHVFMLRGNHETRAVNRVYGFFEECTKRFPDRGEGTQLWTLYQHVFNCLPLAAIVGDRIFAAHGGISEDLKCWRQFSRIRRPTDVTDIGLINDLIWADPCDACDRYAESPRGVSQVFGKVAIDEFEDALKIDLIVRAHQVVMDGYEFFHNKRCLTIFSAPCYCGEMNNIAGILFVSAKLECAIFTYRSPNRAPEEDEDQQIEDGKVGKEDGEKHLDGEIEKQKSGLVGKDTTKPGKQKLTPDQVEKKNREGSSLPCKNENTPSKEGANIRKEREQKKETADAKSIPKQEGYDSPKLKTTPRSSDNSNSAPYNEKQQNKKGDSKVIDRCKEKQNNDNKMVKGQSKKDTGTSSSTQKNESNKKQESESNKRKENANKHMIFYMKMKASHAIFNGAIMKLNQWYIHYGDDEIKRRDRSTP